MVHARSDRRWIGIAILFAVALVVAVGQRPALAADPVARPDSYSTPANTVLNVAAPGVLANDTDADNDPLTAGMPTSPSHGKLLLNENGSFTYTPAAGYTGTDTFTYMAHDGTGGMVVATVTITVGSGGGGGTSPALSVNDVSVTEGSAGVTKTAVFTVKRTGDTTGSSTVKYSTANGTATAGSDYTAITNKTITFAAGVTTMKVKVKVTGDNVKESNETFSVVLSSPTGATVADGTGVGTIVDND
jgi:VCBS repeat-containing protein